MPKTVTLTDADLVALQAIRQAIADTQHPARPTAIAALDRIAAAPEEDPRFPVVTRSGVQPMDLAEPDGYRCSMTEWHSHRSITDITIPTGQDLLLELRRPSGNVVMAWPIEAGDSAQVRALWRLTFSADTRPTAR
jgi:hypothetical protein